MGQFRLVASRTAKRGIGNTSREAEVERLMKAAGKNRYGHRDATMILIAFRHGLRASEVCDLQWHQVELGTGRLHVRRSKRGTPSVHPMEFK
jgi:type 1 fimbriae regulatory protein FimB/type 1 fimbriae regulatory protein FimE